MSSAPVKCNQIVHDKQFVKAALHLTYNTQAERAREIARKGERGSMKGSVRVLAHIMYFIHNHQHKQHTNRTSFKPHNSLSHSLSSSPLISPVLLLLFSSSTAHYPPILSKNSINLSGSIIENAIKLTHSNNKRN